METDASAYAIGSAITQGGRPIAFFSRSLSQSEKAYSSVEKEALAIVDSFRRFENLLRVYPVTVKTDMKSVAFIFSDNKSKVKNEKLLRWRLELAEYRYEIAYKSGSENAGADALSRLAGVSSTSAHKLYDIHDNLAHPGIVRMWNYVRRQNLPYSLDDVKAMTAICQVCCTLKPRFLKVGNDKIVKALKPFERLAMDLVGPKTPAFKTGRTFLLTVVDEYSRFPFAFPLKEITSAAIISCLRSLFSIFGCPSYIHTDRGRQFVSQEFQQFCYENGIARSQSSPYHPIGNGQSERYNGVIWKAVSCLIESRKLPLSHWETVLGEALSSIRTLLCTATNETPHERLFLYTRKEAFMHHIPEWLHTDNYVYLRNFVRNKSEPLVNKVRVVDVISSKVVNIQHENGRQSTVSTSDLAPTGVSIPSQPDIQFNQAKSLLNASVKPILDVLPGDRIDHNREEVTDVTNQSHDPDEIEESNVIIPVTQQPSTDVPSSTYNIPSSQYSINIPRSPVPIGVLRGSANHQDI